MAKAASQTAAPLRGATRVQGRSPLARYARRVPGSFPFSARASKSRRTRAFARRSSTGHPAGPTHPRRPTGAGVRHQPDTHPERPEASGAGAGGGLPLATRYLRPTLQQAGDGKAVRGPGGPGGHGSPPGRAPDRADRSPALSAFFRGLDGPPTAAIVRRYIERDRYFHWRLVELAGNEQLMAALDSVNMMFFAYQDGVVRPPTETIPEHRAILEALGRRDPEASEAAMRVHIRRSIERLEAEAEEEEARTAEVHGEGEEEGRRGVGSRVDHRAEDTATHEEGDTMSQRRGRVTVSRRTFLKAAAATGRRDSPRGNPGILRAGQAPAYRQGDKAPLPDAAPLHSGHGQGVHGPGGGVRKADGGRDPGRADRAERRADPRGGGGRDEVGPRHHPDPEQLPSPSGRRCGRRERCRRVHR